MPIEFHCESCSKLLRVPDGSGGKQCQCPGCSALLNIPIPKADEPVRSAVDSDGDGGTGIAICIPCPKCRHELICDPSLVGTKGQCRSCKHIFVISDSPTNQNQSSTQSIDWVFSCPSCNQLFEGSEAMRGRRGKCHVCGDVFSIELRVANEAPSNSLVKNQKKPTSSFDSDDGELTLDAFAESPRLELAAKQTSSPGTVVSRASRSNLPPIQFNCTSCRGRMEVPGEAARQLTHCPHCHRQLKIPSESEPTPEALAANDPWASLGPLGSAATPMPQSNPFGDTMYPPPMPMSSMSPLTSVSRRRSGDGGMYITCGIFIAIFAVLGIALEMFYIVVGTIGMMQPNVDHTQNAIQILAASIMLVLSLLQLVGGISLARRSGLYMARTGAVICCLPCVCLVLNIPFGIWGCVLAFGKDAERHFR